jgi:hypothetical protein
MRGPGKATAIAGQNSISEPAHRRLGVFRLISTSDYMS